MVSVLCTSSDDPLFFLQSFMKISQSVFELLHGHEIITDGQKDRQTDRWTDKVITIGLRRLRLAGAK